MVLRQRSPLCCELSTQLGGQLRPSRAAFRRDTESDGIGISIGPPKVELGEWAVQGTCVVVHQLLPASSGGDQQPASQSRGRDQARPGPPAGTCAPQQPPNPGIWRRWRNGLRRGGGAVRRPAPRRRAGAAGLRRGAPQVGENPVDHSGWIMKATMRISRACTGGELLPIG